MRTIDLPHGNNTFEGDAKETKGNHKGMPSRTAAYFPTDDRGHIQASMLGGSNDPSNIVPMDRNVNRGSYLHMEYGERDALRSGSTVHSEKTAFARGDKMGRPTAFMTTDTITRSNGSIDKVYNSFTNVSNSEQQSWSDTIDAMDESELEMESTDFGDESISAEEKAAISNFTMGIRENYQPAVFVEFDGSEDFNNLGLSDSVGEDIATSNDIASAEGTFAGGDSSSGEGEGEGSGEDNNLGGIGMSM